VTAAVDEGRAAAAPTAGPAPLVPPAVPRRHAPLLRRLGVRALRASGWRVEGNLPDLPRMVVVVAPHTSNWDFAVGLMAMFALDLAPQWLGKHTIFRPPLGGVLRRLGGIPVRRHGGGPSGREGSVAAVVEEFRRRDAMVLALAPEGTRRRVGAWKSGWYAIAAGAGVPVVPAWIDWSRRVVGFGAAVPAEGGAERLEARLRACYRPEMARRPDRF
jgi:1-acyl-sn-glycerol-3-phosphate acyltransferase